jgi:hypothetical protein
MNEVNWRSGIGSLTLIGRTFVGDSDSLISLLSLTQSRMLLERIVERAKSQISPQVLVRVTPVSPALARVSTPLPFLSR